MSTATCPENSPLENPYETPVETLEETNTASEEAAKPTAMSATIAVAGVFVLLFGYATSAFTVIDLYLPSSPLLSEIVGTTLGPTTLWFFYAIALSTAVAGTLMICSRPIPTSVIVVYFMCPLVAVTYAIGSPLRLAKKWAMPVAAIYLALGTCCGAIAIPKMMAYYAIRDTDEALGAIGFHMLLLAGAACIAGAVTKLINIPTGELMRDRFQTE